MLSLSPHPHLLHLRLLSPHKPFLHSLPSPSLQPATSLSTPLRIQSLSLAAAASPEPGDPTQLTPSDHQLKIAVIGFGNFGQFLAKTLVSRGHTVLAQSRSNHSQAAQNLASLSFRTHMTSVKNTQKLFYSALQ